MRERLGEAHGQLCTALVALHARFASDSEEVQLEWLAYLRRADAAVLESLAACVRRSLLELVRALQGGHKGEDAGSPMFVLNVILDTTNGRWAWWGWVDGWVVPVRQTPRGHRGR